MRNYLQLLILNRWEERPK